MLKQRNTLTTLPENAPASADTWPRQDWGEAPDTSSFFGRVEELIVLRRWVLNDRCRLVGVLGMGGIGKTILVSQLARELAPSFDRVYWRSLRDAPPPGEWLANAVAFVSDQQLALPVGASERIAVGLRLLREQRILLVLDNCETLFEPAQAGTYRAGMAGYGRVLQAVADTPHQSCLLLTSREAPPELLSVLGTTARSFQLRGLRLDDAQALVSSKQLVGTNVEWAELNGRLGGNGLALKLVGETIHDLFGGDIGIFLKEAGPSNIFGGIRRLLAGW